MLEEIKDPYLLSCIVAVWSLIALGILWYRQMLQLPKGADRGVPMALMSPLIAFLLFLSTCAFVPEWIGKALNYCDTHGMSFFDQLQKEKVTQLLTIVVAFILLTGFSLIHSSEIQSLIWGNKQGGKQASLAFLKGVLYTLLTYPIVMIVVQAIHQVTTWVGLEPVQQQIALAELQALEHIPWLFWLFVVAVVTVIPVVEELLFRGFLQNYCSGHLGPRAAIIIASGCFAFFHYAAEQASANIELMIGLFLYSYFMGIFYCRERSLWTTIGMHSCFNLLSVCAMVLLRS